MVEENIVHTGTVCLEIKKSFVLDSARTWLKIWNRVDRGPFTIQGQKGNEIGRVVPKLSTISWCRIYAEPCKKQPLFLKALPWRSSPEPCMPKYAFLNANFRGKSVIIHVFGTKRAIDASYRALDASQRSRKRRSCRWAEGNVRARHGTSAVRFAVPYA